MLTIFARWSDEWVGKNWLLEPGFLGTPLGRNICYETLGPAPLWAAGGHSGEASQRTFRNDFLQGPLLVSITNFLHQHSTSLDLFTSFWVRIPTTYRLCSYLLTHLSSDSSPYFLHLCLVTVCILCFGEWLKISLWLKLDCTLFGTLLFLGVWLGVQQPTSSCRKSWLSGYYHREEHELEWESNIGEVGLCPLPAKGDQVSLFACLLAFTLLLSEGSNWNKYSEVRFISSHPPFFLTFAVQLYPQPYFVCLLLLLVTLTWAQMGYYCGQEFILFFPICPSKWHIESPTISRISLTPCNKWLFQHFPTYKEGGSFLW